MSKNIEKKKNGQNTTTLIMMCIGIVLILIALSILIPQLMDYYSSNRNYEELIEGYVTVEEGTEAEDKSDAADNHDWYENVKIHLDELQQINEDIVGWIRFDNIEIISYPILYSGDDEAYIRTDIYGNASTAGCIFLEGANAPDFQDAHTIIYGHNMKNNSMFGRLKDYNTEGFYEENQFFTIYKAGMAYRYQIFAYEDVPADSDVYTVGFAADDTFQNFIDGLQRKSYVSTDISVTKMDKVVTLSTCSTSGRRFVVHAVRVDEHAY